MIRTITAISLLSYQEGLRHRILYGVLVFSLITMTSSVLISGLFMRDILKIMLDVCLSSISISGLLVPIFLAVTMLSGDIEQKTVYSILSKPVSRAQYILGKYFGLAFQTITIMTITTTFCLLTIWGATFVFAPHFFSSLSLSSILISSAMAMLGILVFNSMVVLWCSLTTSSFLATLLTLATYIIGQSVEDLVRFMLLKIPGAEVSPIVQKTVEIVMYIFPNLAAFDFKLQAAHGLAIPLSEVAVLSVYGASYIFVMLSMANYFFSKRDLP